jgi:hypothetical protein
VMRQMKKERGGDVMIDGEVRKYQQIILECMEHKSAEENEASNKTNFYEAVRH